jgi:hypothetical protein
MDPRPRNTEGQFSPETGGGLDPSTMQAAYNPQIINQRQSSPVMDAIRRRSGKNPPVEETVPSGASDTVLEAKFVNPRTYLLKRLIAFSRSRK